MSFCRMRPPAAPNGTHAVRHHDCHAAGAGLHGLDHVQDEGVVTFGTRRHAAAEAAEFVSVGASKPHFSRLKGGFTTTMSKCLRLAVPSGNGVADGVTHSMR